VVGRFSGPGSVGAIVERVASELDKVIAALEANKTTIQVALAYEVQREMFKRTPVDTGWARANWKVTADPGESLAVAANRPEKDAAGAATVSAAMTASNASIGGLAVKPAKGTAATPIFIANGVPYIGRLNKGHSKQAPSGYIQAGIAQAVRTISRRFKLAKGGPVRVSIGETGGV
jgi:hypothetical protein